MSNEVDLRITSDIQLNVWDFAGKLEYLSTHQYFLSSERSIYLVVVALDCPLAEVERKAQHWLDYLEAKLDPASVEVTGAHRLQVVLLGSKRDAAERMYPPQGAPRSLCVLSGVGGRAAGGRAGGG